MLMSVNSASPISVTRTLCQELKSKPRKGASAMRILPFVTPQASQLVAGGPFQVAMDAWASKVAIAAVPVAAICTDLSAMGRLIRRGVDRPGRRLAVDGPY